MKRKLTVISALLLTFVILFSGCGEPVIEQVTTEKTVSTPTDGNEIPEAESVAFTKLTCWDSDKGISNLCTVLDGKILAVCYDYSDNDTTKTSLYLIDPEKDEIIAEKTLNYYTVVYHTEKAKDKIIFSDYENGKIGVLDAALNESDLCEYYEYASPACDGNGIYAAVDGKVKYIPLEGTEKDVSSSNGLYTSWVDAVSGNGKYYSANVYTSLYDYDTCGGVFDISTGEVLFLEDGYSMFSFNGDSVYASGYNSATGNSIVTKADLLNDTTAYTFTVNEYNSYFSFLPDSRFAVNVTIAGYGENENSSVAEDESVCELYIMDDKPSVCDLSSTVNGVFYNCFSPVDNDRLVAVGHFDGKVGLTLIDTRALEFTDIDTGRGLVNSEIITEYRNSQVIPDVASELNDVRAAADSIEDKYGVTVLISNQCDEICDHSDYSCTTTDSAGYYSEASAISTALETLEEALQMYPDGFFNEFRSSSKDSGVRFMLVSTIESTFNVIAYEYPFGDWYNIVINIDSESMKKDVTHELWHAIEDCISSKDWSVFNNGTWESFNPDGFTYSYDFDSYQYLDSYYTLYGEEPAFIDNYSMVNEKEDRARLVENAMNGDMAAILDSEILSAKLAFLTRTVRTSFDIPDDFYFRWETEQPEEENNGTGTEEEEEYLFEVQTASDGTTLNLRAEPGTESQVIDSIPDGTDLKVFAEYDGWYSVVFNGKSGWISADYALRTYG